ncbi:unnamed protein product [Bursaphelenchus xylophilus]|uniref:(pine wood nematode) hypothetical protein n=1 Tax=Bursaphelenchus xylophilus TaxID=6326 RepID=A0A1I7RW30_BURXY|nr:unnamed protein product [Bursaphelenchus xylophilus]CAG9095057.1 unnamed protein product [Bursaphelenchus xylophilus]
MRFRVLYEYFIYFIILVSILLCMVVMVLSKSLTRSQTRQKRDYAFIVIFNSCLDLLFALFALINMPNAITYEGTLFVINNNPLFRHFAYPQANAVMMLFTDMTLVLSLGQLVHFWYRHDIICHGVTWSRKRYIFKFFSISLVIVSDYVFSVLVRDDVGPFVKLLEETHLCKYSTEAFLMFGMTAVSITKMVVYQVVLTSFYVLLIFFGIKTQLTLRRNIYRSSQKTMEGQRLILRSMAMQAFCPVVTFYLPCSLFIVFAFLKVDLLDSSYYLGSLVHFLPLLNPISVLTLIPSYRRHVLIKFQQRIATVSDFS